jgi:hypothetical protein
VTWVKIESATRMHFKAREAGLEAWGLWVAGLCYCAEYRTDGVIKKKQLSHVWPWMGEGVLALDQADVLLGLATRLVKVGLWDDRVTHWRVHDYLEYQQSRHEIDASRKAARDRQRRHRQKHLPQIDQLPPHLEAQPSRVTHGVTNALVTPVSQEAFRYGTVRYGSDPDPEVEGGDGNGHSEAPPLGLNPSEAVWTVWLRFQAHRRALGRAPERFDAGVESLVERALAWAGGVEPELALLDRFLWIAQHPDAQKGDFKYAEHFRPHIVFDTSKHMGTARDFPVKANGANGKPKHRARVEDTWYPCGDPSCTETTDHAYRP